MPAETDLATMLASLDVERRPEPYAFVSLPGLPDGVTPAAVVVEAEGVTVIVPVSEATRRGWPVAFEAAWLTLSVYSALDAVGLTAAVSAVLAEAGVPCNVLAGVHHDHLLVPVDEADTAIAALRTLAR